MTTSEGYNRDIELPNRHEGDVATVHVSANGKYAQMHYRSQGGLDQMVVLRRNEDGYFIDWMGLERSMHGSWMEAALGFADQQGLIGRITVLGHAENSDDQHEYA